jgi:H+/Cl- antiporter ClcA
LARRYAEANGRVRPLPDGRSPVCILIQIHEVGMKKRILNKRFFLTNIGASAIGILLSRLVFKPLMHVAGDPPWLRQAVIVTLLGVIVGLYALALFMRFAARRRNSIKL